MTLPTWYDTGTVSVANGSPTVAGTGTLWGGDAIMAGDLFCDLAQPLVPPQRIASVEANGALTLAAPWPGTALTADAYEIRYVGIIERSTSQTRRVLEQLGEVSAFFDIQVNDEAARLALESAENPLRANYRVLVSDTGDGTSAIYSKASGAYDDWTDPAPYSGPVGPTPTVTIDDVTTLAPGSSATVTSTPVTGGVELDFGIPAGRGSIHRGGYNPATAFVLDDSVLDNGSTWIALGNTTGNAPPTLPSTSNAFWQLIARRGTDGTGTGDVVGPAAATLNAFALFADTTGKLLKTLSYSAVTALLNAFVGDSGLGGTKGLVPAPTAGDAVAAKFLKADGTWAAVPIADLENKIINGDFLFAQRATSQAVSGYVSLDRWYFGVGTTATATWSQQAHTIGQVAVPGNPEFFLRCARTVAGSTESFAQQLIEGAETLQNGLATVTFWAKASVATSIQTYLTQYFGSGGSAAVDLARRTHALTTSWQKFTYVGTLASIAGKTVAGGNDALVLNFAYPTASANASVDISHVSVVEGDATGKTDPFTPRHPGQELALCQRYYEFIVEGLIYQGPSTSASNYSAQCRWAVTKRVSPTVTLSNVGTSNFPTTNPSLSSNAQGTRGVKTASATSASSYWVHDVAASAEL